MKTIKFKYLFAPVLLAIFIFSTDFLSTDLFQKDLSNFAVWFVLSVFAFATGWNINKTLGWKKGSKIIFTIIVVVSFITLFFITYFNRYFNISAVLVENLILFVLRNFVIGAMGIFGLSMSELFYLQKEIKTFRNKTEMDSEINETARKEADLIVSEAKLEAEKIIFDAEKKVDKILEQKNKIEEEISEFIRIEKELIEKYDKDNV